MYAFEREALGIESIGEIRGGLTITGTVDMRSSRSVTWWIASFYAPDIWDSWRVGLIRESICITASSPVALPNPIEFEAPWGAGQPAALPDILPRRIIVTPAIVKGRALAFVVRDPDAPPTHRLADPGPHLELVAPTDLVARLGLREGESTPLRLLSAQAFRPAKRTER
ncbi:MAG: hypothetical protein PVJ64_07620 [Gemmatimonadales bacterium]|jgi:hypothetical protein